MNKYELVYLVDARLSDADKGEVAKLVAEMITKNGGKILNSAVWFERQRMSFPIKKTWEATYYLLNIEGNAPEMAKFRRELEINERVLRFLILKIETPKAPKVRKAPKAK
ncbi:MAG: 30S ribosomal protein S6 [Candidatus Omnitrophica bacterium]|nr:30S ribosomal protein S6 [Candidatus Omnitrophota bacterium]